MRQPGFVIAGDGAVRIANDNADFRYRASAHYLAVGVQVPVRCHEHAEMQFMVEDGIVEFMIGGASGMVLGGDFVRVPAGMPYAYRNAGDSTARLLMRSVNPQPARRASKVQATFAA
ncbi:MAG TPA: cupin domain-containing protein [Devosia sp.]|nr:cupin domain-containing protein [Devosia sp.]